MADSRVSMFFVSVLMDIVVCFFTAGMSLFSSFFVLLLILVQSSPPTSHSISLLGKYRAKLPFVRKYFFPAVLFLWVPANLMCTTLNFPCRCLLLHQHDSHCFINLVVSYCYQPFQGERQKSSCAEMDTKGNISGQGAGRMLAQDKEQKSSRDSREKLFARH